MPGSGESSQANQQESPHLRWGLSLARQSGARRAVAVRRASFENSQLAGCPSPTVGSPRPLSFTPSPSSPCEWMFVRVACRRRRMGVRPVWRAAGTPAGAARQPSGPAPGCCLQAARSPHPWWGGGWLAQSVSRPCPQPSPQNSCRCSCQQAGHLQSGHWPDCRSAIRKPRLCWANPQAACQLPQLS